MNDFVITDVIRVVGDLALSNPEPDLAGFRNSNAAGVGSGFGENLFWDHRTICPMKLMVSTMLSTPIKWQNSSVLYLFCLCLPVFDKICGTAMGFVFLSSE